MLTSVRPKPEGHHYYLIIKAVNRQSNQRVHEELKAIKSQDKMIIQKVRLNQSSFQRHKRTIKRTNNLILLTMPTCNLRTPTMMTNKIWKILMNIQVNPP